MQFIPVLVRGLHLSLRPRTFVCAYKSFNPVRLGVVRIGLVERARGHRAGANPGPLAGSRGLSPGQVKKTNPHLVGQLLFYPLHYASNGGRGVGSACSQSCGGRSNSITCRWSELTAQVVRQDNAGGKAGAHGYSGTVENGEGEESTVVYWSIVNAIEDSSRMSD